MRRLAALAVGAVALFGSAAVPATAEEPFDPVRDYEAFWTLYDEHYALMDVKGVDWDALGAVYRAQVTPETTRDELFTVFEAITDHLNDVHVTVRDERTGRFARSGARSLGTGPMDDGRFSSELIEEAYADGALAVRGGGKVSFGWLPDDVGYLRIEAFKYPTTAEAAADEMTALLADARAVIVDVRHDGGGSDAVARMFAARFADEARTVMTSEAMVPGTGALAEPVPWVVEPADRALTMPIILLVDDRTISAAENFAIMMRAFGHVTIIGETTAGALADTFTHRIGGGWVFGVPSNVLRDAGWQSWEGIGVVPNVWVSNTPADIEGGRDLVLEAASSLGRHLSADSEFSDRIGPAN